MMLPVFVVTALEALPGGTVELDGEEGRHAVRVRRLRAGERLVLTDGAGTAATCRVRRAERDTLCAEVLAVETAERPTPRITVVQAIAKGDRAELAVELLTELGVDRIVPWAASRSVAVWRGERARRALERWRSTARAAAKQSRRVWFPEVAEPADTAGVCALLTTADVPVVLHEEALEDGPGAMALSGLDLDGATEIVLVVGPEGGIAPDELAAFVAVPGVRVCRLGPTVLRTSTAGAAAVAALSVRTRWA